LVTNNISFFRGAGDLFAKPLGKH